MAGPCDDLKSALDQAQKRLNDAIKNDEPDILELKKARDAAQAAYEACLANPSLPTPTNFIGQCMTNMGEWTYHFIADAEGRILYNKWKMGGGPVGWHEMPGGARTDAAPAAAAVASSNYLFVTIKNREGGGLLLNQGGPGPNPENQENWVGWL